MIVLKELNPHNYPTTPVIDKNLGILLERMNELRAIWAKPMIVTSGLRSDAQQAELIAQGKSTARVSKHLSGSACDIGDKDGSLAKWCLENEAVLTRIGLWCEHPDYTKGWMHFQSVPPMSGKRFYMP
jgi:uncharacterized protein YcbK (DUF882 family)